MVAGNTRASEGLHRSAANLASRLPLWVDSVEKVAVEAVEALRMPFWQANSNTVLRCPLAGGASFAWASNA
jgi:hypothetical protein